MVGEREEDPEAGSRTVSNSDLGEMTEIGGGYPLGLVLLHIAQAGPVLVVERWDNGAMETRGEEEEEGIAEISHYRISQCGQMSGQVTGTRIYRWRVFRRFWRPSRRQ